MLAAAGFKPIAYYPYNTFLVRVDSDQAAAQLATLPAVAWVGVFEPFFKLAPEIGLALQTQYLEPLIGDNSWGLRTNVVLHQAEASISAKQRLTAIGGVHQLPTRGPIRITVDPTLFSDVMPRIAALPEVAAIEVWRRAELLNDENVQNSQSGVCTDDNANETTNTTIFNRGITGWNVRLTVADSCTDANEGWFYDTALGRLSAHETAAPWNMTSPDWPQRKLIEYYDMWSGDTTLGCGGAVGDAGDHGTHVAGTVAGNCNLDSEGLATQTDPANSAGDNDGVAPGALLIVQDLGNGTANYLDDDGGTLGELIDVAYNQTCVNGSDCGIDAHNNSWGDPTDQYDHNARTADQQLELLQDLVVLVAMGNDGVGGFGTVSAPATAKNVVGVGSALECSVNDVKDTSSRGDTHDGRLKPDVMATGVNVTSARNDGSANNANDPCSTLTISGTSMAAPTMAGLSALVLQYLNDGFYPTGVASPADALDPSGMLIKAMLINSAQPMTGAGADQSANSIGWPNMDQGYGFTVLENTLFFPGDARNLYLHDEATGVDSSGAGQGTSMWFQRRITDSSEPLKVTLTWYDDAGTMNCNPCLVNDLDLTVTEFSTGTTYSVTRIADGSGHLVPRTVVPAAPGAGQTTIDNGADTRNSVEQIIVYNPPLGANFTITVTASSTPGGPVPFGLVVTGATAMGAGAELSVTLDDLTDPVFVGENITWLLGAANGGPTTATQVVLTVTLPSTVSFVSTNHPSICAEASGVVTCEIETLASGESFTGLELVAQSNDVGAVAIDAEVTAQEPDPELANNVATETTEVIRTCVEFDSKLTPSPEEQGAAFGSAVAISGDTMVIGADFDTGVVPDSGAVYVFVRSGQNWSLQQKLYADDGANADTFGRSVAIDGDVIVVGAQLDYIGSTRKGSAYVFVRSGESWSQEQKLIASDGALGDLFGAAVAVEGQTIVVTATGDDSTAGAAYVFLWNGSQWLQEQKVVALDREPLDVFGWSVDIDSGTIVVGATRDDDAATLAGAVYVFSPGTDGWVQEEKLYASDGSFQAEFGSGVDLSGDILIVGAREDDALGNNTGAAYAFQRSGGWNELQKLSPGDPGEEDRFGHPVSVAGGTIVVGARYDDDAGTDSGSAYVFAWDGSSWVQNAKLVACDSQGEDRFGTVAIDDNVVAVGANGSDGALTNSGAAYLYDVGVTSPPPTVKVTAPMVPATYLHGDNLTIEWTTTNASIFDDMVLAMKRDAVPAMETEPDGINWFRFNLEAVNDGSEEVEIPPQVAVADDWRFYVRHEPSDAYDGTYFTSTVDCIDSDADSVCDADDLCPGFDDTLDGDGDGVPDGCDVCPGFDDNLDADGDGVPDGCDACFGTDDLLLTNEDVSGTVAYEACTSITAGNGFRLLALADVTFRAGSHVILTSDFLVENGATFQIEIDPELLPQP